MNEALLDLIASLPQTEVIATLKKLVFPWEYDIEIDSFVRKDVTGKIVCRGQKNQRDMDRSDESLREQGFMFLASGCHYGRVCAID